MLKQLVCDARCHDNSLHIKKQAKVRAGGGGGGEAWADGVEGGGGGRRGGR